MAGIGVYLEREVGLPVNREKSEVVQIKDVTFLDDFTQHTLEPAWFSR